MDRRICLTRLLPAAVLAALVFPASASAQVGLGVGASTAPGYYGPYASPFFGFAAWPGYRGAIGSYWTNGLSLYGPPVPTAGPIPGVFGNYDLSSQWQQRASAGFTGYPGYGVYVPLGRRYPRLPPAPVIIEPLPPTPIAPGPVGCVMLSVRVPQPNAEVFIAGVKMTQTGFDRLYMTPPLPADKQTQIEVSARWTERAVIVERKKVAVGVPGEVVRVDLGSP